ncbi:sigma-70 family RNA polymerase sigma factor [Streptomyces sp. SID8380]|nr:sigma-70 family RNA polymerase sigma factor [Streptomyces sp. SID8380]
MTTMFKKDLYDLAIDDNEELEGRWKALHQLMDHKLHNPHLGDIDIFVQENKGLVALVAKRSMYKTKYKVEFEDLMQEGYIGLIKAYCNYTPDRSTSFSTYAYYHISNQIMRYIAEKVPMIRTPRGVYELAGRILKRKLGEASAEEISKELGCTVDAANRALKNLKGSMVLSLNLLVSESTSQRVELGNILPQEQDFTNYEVEEFIDSLSSEMKKTLELALENKTQKQIGKELGCSQMQACRLISRIREKANRHFGEVIA